MKEKNSLRVLFLIENVPYSLDTRVQREADVVKRMGGQVVIICPTDGGRIHSQIDGFDVYQYPKPQPGQGFVGHLFEYGASLFFHFWFTAYVAIRHGFDIIHAANPPDIFFIVAAPYKLFGKYFIFDHHDLVPELFDVRYGDRVPALRSITIWMEKCSMRLANHVISTNESFRTIALTRGGKAPNDVTIVRNGPWLARHFSNISIDESVRDLGDIVIGYVGYMNPQDHLDNLLEAARIIRFELHREDIGFVLIGSGDSHRSLLELRDQLGLTDAVRMPGTLPWADVVGALAATDICVQPDLPTLFNVHLTMNKLMEYMAVGKAAIAYDMTETRFTGADTVVYVEENTSAALAATIVELSDDAIRRSALGKRARTRIETLLSWEIQSEQLVSVYKSMLPTAD